MLILGCAAEFPHVVANVEERAVGSTAPRSLPLEEAGPGQALKLVFLMCWPGADFIHAFCSVPDCQWEIAQWDCMHPCLHQLLW